MRGVLVTICKWPIALACLALLFGVAFVIHRAAEAERKTEADEAVKQPERKKADDIVLGPELAEKEGVKDEPARAVRWQPRLTVYGRVVPNPRATIEVRAPFAGSLRAVDGKPWPALGSRLKAREKLGWLDIRVGPQEQLDMQAKLHEARLKEKNAAEVFRIHQQRYQRLAAAQAGVSQSDVDAARVQMLNARTDLDTAKAAVARWQEALTDIQREARKGDVWSRRLSVPVNGEIVEMQARPGTALEAGGLIARLVDFSKVLVRLDIPLFVLAKAPPVRLKIVAVGSASQNGSSPEPVWGNVVGRAGEVDPVSQLAGCWYEIDLAKSDKDDDRFAEAWRPGLFVKAEMPDSRQKPASALAVPASALVYHEGQTFIYVREAPGRFERRRVRVLGRDGTSAVLSGAVRAGEPVVYQGAQVLLSEEFRETGKADD